MKLLLQTKLNIFSCLVHSTVREPLNFLSTENFFFFFTKDFCIYRSGSISAYYFTKPSAERKGTYCFLVFFIPQSNLFLFYSAIYFADFHLCVKSFLGALSRFCDFIAIVQSVRYVVLPIIHLPVQSKH